MGPTEVTKAESDVGRLTEHGTPAGFPGEGWDEVRRQVLPARVLPAPASAVCTWTVPSSQKARRFPSMEMNQRQVFDLPSSQAPKGRCSTRPTPVAATQKASQVFQSSPEGHSL